ncbi:MAG: hypothetical protein ACOY3X_02110 [Pseudomonadota bacterium]
MTPFLIALLAGLLVAGALTIVYRERRQHFRRAVELTAAGALVVAGYAMWISGGELQRADAAIVGLHRLQMIEAAGSFRLEGQVQNRSENLHIVTLPVRLRVEDCPAAGDCTTLHEETAEVPVSVGPGETVAFRRVYAATAGPAHGTRRWRVWYGDPRVNEARAR